VARGGRRKERGEGRLTGGAQMSASREKGKGEEERWASAGKARRVAGPSGLKGKPARFSSFFSFSNHFSSQIQIKLFQTFFSRIL
jgi:hypothetical protein